MKSPPRGILFFQREMKFPPREMSPHSKRDEISSKRNITPFKGRWNLLQERYHPFKREMKSPPRETPTPPGGISPSPRRNEQTNDFVRNMSYNMQKQGDTEQVPRLILQTPVFRQAGSFHYDLICLNDDPKPVEGEEEEDVSRGWGGLLLWSVVGRSL